MFTGLIESIGRVRTVVSKAGVRRLSIETELRVDEMRDGESIAVDGVCLTVARRCAPVFEADAVAETLAHTTIGDLRAGDVVHLERALAVGDRLGGHLVSGHVDVAAKVRSLRHRGGDVRLEVDVPAKLRRFMALKGSITLHGVSLTVAGVKARSVEVALVPETLARTKLGRLTPGERVNVEVDVVARYLEALMREKRR